jgi:hypothetical protein
MSDKKIQIDDEIIDENDVPEDIRGKEAPAFIISGDSIIESILARRLTKKKEPESEESSR